MTPRRIFLKCVLYETYMDILKQEITFVHIHVYRTQIL